MNHVLPFHQKVTIDYYLLDEVNPCVVTWYVIKLLINSKIEDIFFENHKINELYQLYQNSYVQKLKIKNNKFNQNINLINKCEKEHLLCCIVIFSTKFQPVPLARNLMSITKNRQLSKRGP